MDLTNHQLAIVCFAYAVIMVITFLSIGRRSKI